MKEDAGKIELLLRRLEVLEGQRKTFETHWQWVGELIWPQMADFQYKWHPGERRTRRQYDMTAALALEKFSAALESLLTPRAQKWHTLKASDDVLNRDPAVQRWFDDVTKILFDLRQSPKAGFYGAMQIKYKSLGAFGNGCLFVEGNRQARIRGERSLDRPISYRHVPLSQVFVSDDANGQIDLVYDKYELTNRQAFELWGHKPDFPEELARDHETKPFEKTEFVRCVAPDGMGDWDAVEISRRYKQALAFGHYKEMPYIFSRFTVNPSEVYGRGPAMMMLPDISSLQEMERSILRTAHRIADPPLLAADDDVIGTGGKRVTLRPGSINYGGLDAQGNPRLQPLVTGGNPGLTEQMMDRKRANINDAFFVALFQVLVETPNMTATEALLRAQEKGQLLAPTVGRQQQESLGPLIEREVGLLARMGVLPPPPDVLLEAEGEYKIEYVSPATRMQRLEEILGVTRSIEVMAPFIQLDPSLLEVMNAEEVFRLAAEVTGVPSKLVRTPEELARVRQARQAAADEQRMIEALPQIAKAAKDASQAADTAPRQIGPGR